MEKTITKDEALFFRDQLQEARFKAQQDAEAFGEIAFVLERLGSFLTEKQMDLGRYRDSISNLARCSPLFYEVPQANRAMHTPFLQLYDLVRNARNGAMHGGAAARSATSHAVQLALVIEDALMNSYDMVADFMAKNVMCAELWQPLSFLRQAMLENSFSCLPVKLKSDSECGWKLLLERSLAKCLRSERANGQRKNLLLQPLGEAIKNDGGLLIQARTCKAAESVSAVAANWDGQPIFVTREGTDELLGIPTPYDLL